jgi:FkbH-like protein
LLRAVDLVRYRDDWSERLLDELFAEYANAFERLSQRASGRMPIVIGFLPDASGDPRFAAWDDKLAARLSKLSGLSVLRAEDFYQHYPVDERFAPEADAMGHMPFSPQFVAAIALTLTRKVWGLRRRPLKVVAVDGDSTLWSGVAGEIGPDAVDLSGPRAALGQKLLALRDAGVLLVLVSNNDDATVRQVLARPDSVLHAEHFSVISAAWDQKHERLARAAETLNLGLDGFVFLDDNPVEIAAVRARLPEVMAVTVPEADELESFLSNLWALDVHAVTNEDRKRALYYREESSRQALRDELEDFSIFVERLGLELEIALLTDDTVERSVQLSRRTNQFNLRPGTLDAHALRAFAERTDAEVWTLSVRDRFGDYGQVGVIGLTYDAHTIEVQFWMLSCRVLGRGVEERMLRWLAERTERLERAELRLIAEHTPRNVPARRLLAALSGGHVDNQRLEARLAPERLRAVRFFERSSETVERTGDADAHGL